MEGITKHFGSVVANRDINLELHEGEILSLLGENGSGKTTLMNMLSGIYYPDEGQIFIHDKPVVIRSPKDAFENGIGMIHQHFKLVDVFTATENIILGLKEKGMLDLKRAAKRIKEISEKYGFEIDPNQKVYNMSVSQKQTVEIIKVLYRGADILILDEPTAVLTPQETDKLFAVMRNMQKDGKSLIIITHKLHEVLEVSDRVAILRKGEYVGDVPTRDASQQSLTDMMVGRAVSLNIDRPKAEELTERLRIEHLTVRDAEGVKRLDDVSFSAYGGEILGIAGIAGSGQRELLESIAGLQHATPESNIVYIDPQSGEERKLNDLDPLKIIRSGILLSFVPEDRFGMGLVGGMSIADNVMLRSYRRGKHNPFLDRRFPKELSNKIVNDLEVVTPNIDKIPLRRLSGGNVQKVLVGREIEQSPTVLMTAYAVRGLDINTSYTIYNLLTAQKMKGVAVIYVGEDLDVLLELCDRILVLCGGQVSGIVDARSATKEQIGLMMTQHRKGTEETEPRNGAAEGKEATEK
jgi:simple sugar transport system ATP-binding protein